MSLSPYTQSLGGSASDGVSVTETYDVPTRGRRGLLLVDDLTVEGNGHSFVDGAAVSLPVTVSAGANTSFKFNSIEYTIVAGTYTTLAQVIAAINGALNVATRFDTVVVASASATVAGGIRFTNVATGVHAEAFAVGTTHDGLVSVLGITAAWTIAHTLAAVADGGAGSYTVTIQGKDEASGKFYTLLTAAVHSTVSTQILQVHPEMVASPNLVACSLLPATIRVSITHGNSNVKTRTLGLQLVS